MWRTHKGHFVQIWLPSSPPSEPREFVEVTHSTRRGGWSWKFPTTEAHAGWRFTGREKDLRTAKKLAKQFQQAGFHARIVFRNSENQANQIVVADYPKKRNKK